MHRGSPNESPDTPPKKRLRAFGQLASGVAGVDVDRIEMTTLVASMTKPPPTHSAWSGGSFTNPLKVAEVRVVSPMKVATVTWSRRRPAASRRRVGPGTAPSAD